mgnify:CR=1 FL=1
MIVVTTADGQSVTSTNAYTYVAAPTTTSVTPNSGGEVIEYTKMLAEAREQALDRMIEEAQTLEADAVICVRFQTSMVMAGAAEMLAYGTAVTLEPTS